MSSQEMFLINEDGGYDKVITKKTFYELGFLERRNLEEWVIEEPRILGEELLVISSEFGDYRELSERLDILALDREGKLVVVELKRDRANRTADLQAIKYASYVANFTAKDVQDLYQDFWTDREKNELTSEDVGKSFLDFLEDSEEEVVISENGFADFTLDSRPRIIIAAGSFGKEITSPVIWLTQEFGLDITCVELQLYEHDENTLLGNRVIIPVPETEEYMAERRQKQEEQSSSRKEAAIRVLLRRGVLNKGETVIFNEEKLPTDASREFDPEDDHWRVEITGETGQSDNVKWLHNGQLYSFTGVTLDLLEDLTGKRRQSLNGYNYWVHPEYDYRTLSDLRNSGEGKS